MKKLNNNSTALAGEFAVLSYLYLRGYDANMMLGNTKGIDILVYDPETDNSYQLEVKTNNNKSSHSKIFGNSIGDWVMNEKHEQICKPKLFYCFVSISKDGIFKFYIVPNRGVARYVEEEHKLWLREKKKEGKTVEPNDIRTFRLGRKDEKYPIATPTADEYENNWDFAESQ
jgi:hypothetical protein